MDNFDKKALAKSQPPPHKTPNKNKTLKNLYNENLEDESIHLLPTPSPHYFEGGSAPADGDQATSPSETPSEI